MNGVRLDKPNVYAIAGYNRVVGQINWLFAILHYVTMDEWYI